MRDPMSWALPLPFRAFGIPVKVHVFFFVITIGLFLRQVSLPENIVSPLDVFLFTIVVLFGIIYLHELGHCFAARAVGGEANEILIWPLGGLAFADVPHHWRAHTVLAAGGPITNLVICIACAVPLIAAGYWPNMNLMANPYQMPVKNYVDGKVHTSIYEVRLYKPNTNPPEPAMLASKAVADEINAAFAKKDFAEADKLIAATGFERAVAPTWVVWVARTFWLSWLLFLFNLLPAYPMDGGQIMQGLIWAKSGHRQGVLVAAYSGFVVALLFLVASISMNEALLVGLAMFMMFVSHNRLQALDADDGGFGYDFSAGYTSLERDEPPAHRPRKHGFFKRWLQARKARRHQREVEERQQEEERFDQLLEKVHKSGKASLSDEERRFMERVSARYRNRS